MQASIWELETFYKPQDVVIIGSGFAGLWSAYFLKRKHPKLAITIIERGPIPTGASTRNAGFACFGSLSEVIDDARKMGTDAMLELVEMRFQGLEKIRRHFSSGEIDYIECGGYELYEPGDSYPEALDENISYINSLFKPFTKSKHTYQRADATIREFGFGKTKHLVRNHLEGYLHSGKLVAALLRTVQKMGVQVFNSTELKSYERVNGGFHLQTSLPVVLSTEKLLVCTNAFTKQFFPSIDIVPARGQVILTSPIEGLPWRGTFHSDEGYFYFRNLDNRVLLGGARNRAFADEETYEMNTSEFIQQELERYLAEVVLPNFEGAYQVENRWAGIMAMGSEKRPIVKELENNIYCAVRMSGMGVALAPVVAKKVAAMMY